MTRREEGEGGLTDDESYALNEDIQRRIEDANIKYGFGGIGRKKLEILSVEQMLRKDSGHYGVKGIIVGISSVEHVVMSTVFGCQACMKKAKRSKSDKSGSFEKVHDPPLFLLPHNLGPNKILTKCLSCNSQSFGPQSHKQKAVIRIQLQDEEKQNNLENLTVVLFESDTLNIRNGEKVIVEGDVKVIQQHSRNANRVTYLFAKEGKLKYERPENSQVVISKRDYSLMKKLVKQPDYTQKLTKMFAPTIIGEETSKLGIIVEYVGALETEDFRGRIHGLLVGPPGTAKSKLAWQAKKLGEPNSRYSSMEGSSGKSLGVIIDKEGDSYVARSGILVQAKNSVCVLNEVGALSEEDQRHLFSVMEEGIVPVDKYAFHKEIEAKTTVLGTLNPRASDWYSGTVSKEQIPLRRELIDRYDLIFAFKDTENKEDKQEYGRKKLEIVQKSLNGEINPEIDYILLRKIIQHAKTFNPIEFTEEANSMLVGFYSNLGATVFPSRRVFDVATRVSMAFARLHFSDVVTAELAKKALDFLRDVFKEFDSAIVVIEDPRELVCKEIADFYQKRPDIPFDFNDTVESIKNRSPMLDTYLGNGKGLDTQSHKFRALRERFLDSPPVVQGLIVIQSHNPLRLMFRPENVKPKSPSPDPNHDHSQSNTTSAVFSPGSLVSSEYKNLIREKYLAGPGRTIYYCAEHDDIWNIDPKDLETSHFIPDHKEANE
jgi:DNA replicative helicase MCM subunit Mcm2 (Cdc46/Mcm family)